MPCGELFEKSREFSRKYSQKDKYLIVMNYKKENANEAVPFCREKRNCERWLHPTVHE